MNEFNPFTGITRCVDLFTEQGVAVSLAELDVLPSDEHKTFRYRLTEFMETYPCIKQVRVLRHPEGGDICYCYLLVCDEVPDSLIRVLENCYEVFSVYRFRENEPVDDVLFAVSFEVE